MIALETEYGRFEADTLRKATTLAKKAKRAAELEEQRKGAARELAYAKAGAKAYWHIKHKREGRTLSHPWLCRPDGNHFKAKKLDRWGHTEHWVVWVDDKVSGIDLISYRPIAILYRCDGSVDLVWTEDCDRGERFCLAVGVHDDQWATVELPIEDFPPEYFEPKHEGAETIADQAE